MSQPSPESRIQPAEPWLPAEETGNFLGIARFCMDAESGASMIKGYELLYSVTAAILQRAIYTLPSPDDSLAISLRDLAGSMLWVLDAQMGGAGGSMEMAETLVDAGFDPARLLVEDEQEVWLLQVEAVLPAVVLAAEQHGIETPVFTVDTLPYEAGVPFPTPPGWTPPVPTPEQQAHDDAVDAWWLQDHGDQDNPAA